MRTTISRQMTKPAKVMRTKLPSSLECKEIGAASSLLHLSQIAMKSRSQTITRATVVLRHILKSSAAGKATCCCKGYTKALPLIRAFNVELSGHRTLLRCAIAAAYSTMRFWITLVLPGTGNVCPCWIAKGLGVFNLLDYGYRQSSFNSRTNSAAVCGRKLGSLLKHCIARTSSLSGIGN